MRGKNKDGTFQTPFNPLKWGDAFTEGNSWHYSWSVFHDIEGLKKLMGGNEMFAKMLDSVFVMPPVFDDSYYGGVIHEIREMQIMNMGQYAHGNQPIQHMIYLYNYARRGGKARPVRPAGRSAPSDAQDPMSQYPGKSLDGADRATPPCGHARGSERTVRRDQR